MEQITEEELPEVNYRYFDFTLADRLESANVSYVIFDKEDKPVTVRGYYTYDAPETKELLNIEFACYSAIFRNGVPVGSKTFFVFVPLARMPYKEPELVRWVNDLTEFGFPCKYNGVNGGNVVFEVDIEEMKTKAQFCSLITLLRATFEMPGTIPELYFQMVDDNPEMNKFFALQEAHLSNRHNPYSPWGGPSPGHNLLGPTLDYNVVPKKIKLKGRLLNRYPSKKIGRENMTVEEVFQRFGSITPFQEGPPSLNAAWSGKTKETIAA